VKHKKLMDDSGEVSVTQYNAKDEDISDALKNGCVTCVDVCVCVCVCVGGGVGGCTHTYTDTDTHTHTHTHTNTNTHVHTHTHTTLLAFTHPPVIVLLLVLGHNNRYLRLEDKHNGSWTKHYFVLTRAQISYTETAGDVDEVHGDDGDDDDEEEEEDEEDKEGDDDDAGEEQRELHQEEQWFHGKLAGGRHAATELIERTVAALPPEHRDGVFLVRESDTFDG
jgi:hypothetical protein